MEPTRGDDVHTHRGQHDLLRSSGAFHPFRWFALSLCVLRSPKCAVEMLLNDKCACFHTSSRLQMKSYQSPLLSLTNTNVIYI